MKTTLLTFRLTVLALFVSLFAFSQNVQIYDNGIQYYTSVNKGAKGIVFYSTYTYNFGTPIVDLKTMAVRLVGTATAADVPVYRLYRANNISDYLDGNATLVATAAGVNLSSTASIISFTGLNSRLINYYDPSNLYRLTYYYVAADVDVNATSEATFASRGVASLVVSTTTSAPYNGTASTSGTTHTISGTSSSGSIEISNTFTAFGSAGQNDIEVLRFNSALTGGATTIKSLTLPLSGTFVGADFDQLTLYYNNNSNSQLVAVATVSGAAIDGASSATFTLPVPFSLISSGGRFIVRANIAEIAIPGHKLIIGTFDGTNLAVENALIGGSVTNQNSIQINSPGSVAINEIATTETTFSPGTDYNVLYKADLTRTGSSSILKGLSFKASGTFTTNDISEFTLWIGNSNNFYQYTSWNVGTLTAVGAGGVLNFTNFERLINSNNRYLYLTANVKPTATLNRTILLDAVNSADYNFVSGTITGTPLAQTTKTIKAPNIAISQVAMIGSKIGQGVTLTPIYTAKISVKNADAVLNLASFDFEGDFTSEDVNYFRLYYGTTNDFQQVGNYANNNNYNGTGASVTFSGLNILIDKDTDGYLFVAVAVENEATVGHTINVKASSTAKLGFVSAVKTGSLGAGATFTVAKPIVTAQSIPLSTTLLGLNTDENIIYKVKLTVTNASTNLNSFNFNTTGTYTDTDLKYYYPFRVVYSRNDIFGDDDDDYLQYFYGSNSTGAGENFNGNLDKQLPIGDNYIFVISDITNSATDGRTISIKSSTGIDMFDITSATITSKIAAGTVLTISRPKTKFSTIVTTLAGNTLAPDDKETLIYTLEVDNQDLPSNVTNIDFTIGGNYNSSDFNYFYIRKTKSVIYDADEVESEYYFGASSPGQLLGRNFGSFPKGKTYLHVFIYTNSGAETGKSVFVSTVSGIQVQNGTFTGAGIQVGTPYSVQRIATIKPIATQNYIASPSVRNYLYGFKVQTNSNFNFNQLVLSISGTLDPDLLSNYTLYYTANDSTTQNLSYYGLGNYSTASGQNLTFTGVGPTLFYSNTYYFYVSANIANTTLVGSTVKFQPERLSSFGFSDGATAAGSFALPQSHVLAIPSVAVSTLALPSKAINADGSTEYALYRLELNATAPAKLIQFPITMAGSYTNAAIYDFGLKFSYSAEFQENNSTYEDTFGSNKTVATVAGESFVRILNTSIPQGKTYLYVVARLNATTTTGVTIQVKSVSVPGIALAVGSVTGSEGVEGNVFTTKNGAVAISSISVAGKYLPSNSYEEVYTVKLTVSEVASRLNNVYVKTKGTYTVSDVRLLYGYLSKSPSFNSIDVLYSTNNSLSAGNAAVLDVYMSNTLLEVGDTYLHLVASRQSTNNSSTFGIEGVTVNSSNFVGGAVAVTGTLPTGELHTVLGSYLYTHASTSIAVGGGKINLGTTKVVYATKVTIKDANGYLNQFSLSTAGNYVAGDIAKTTLWYSKSEVFDGSATSIAGIVPTKAGEQWKFSNDYLLSEGDYYFFVTAYVSPTATIGNGFYIKSFSGSSILYDYALSGTGVSLRTPDFSFGVPSANNDLISFSLPDQIGIATISGTTITVNLPIGSSLAALVATFGIDGYATALVGTTKQTNNVTANNFSSPVVYKITSETGVTKDYTVTVNLVELTVTNVAEVASVVAFYPNPASDYLYIQTNEYSKVVVYDLIGNKVLAFELRGESNKVNISALPAGVYFATFSNNERSLTKKLVVKH